MESIIALLLVVLGLLLAPVESLASDGWTGPGCYLWLTLEDMTIEDEDDPYTYNIIVSGPYDGTCGSCFTKINSEEFKQEKDRRWPDNWGGGCGQLNTQTDWDAWA